MAARWRNGEHGYGLVTKVLHWLTVALLVAQFAVGLTMGDDHESHDATGAVAASAPIADDGGDDGGDGGGRESHSGHGRGHGEDEDHGAIATSLLSGDGFADGLQGIELHMVLGVLLLALGALRLAWRRTTPLPPWAEHLSAGERRLEGWLEKALLTLLLVVPATGLLLLLGDDDLLPLHVAAQLLLVAVVLVHVGLVLEHTVLRQHRHLSRMV